MPETTAAVKPSAGLSSFRLGPEQSGQRLDVALTSLLPQLSRSQVSKLFRQEAVWIGGKPARPGSKCAAGLLVGVRLPEPSPPSEDQRAEAIPLDIRYEDDYLLVINKPKGMVVHPAAGHHSGTLVNALLYHCGSQLSDVNGAIRPGIVHRLDKDTSGLMLAVKTNEVHRQLAAALQRREIKRTYMAIVHGHFAERLGTVDLPLGRDPSDRQRQAVVSGGRGAVTRFEVLEDLRAASLLKLKLETGRTHQIRVHMSYIGHPVVGDPIYSGRRETYGIQGQALHACRLCFTHPVTGKIIDISCEPPADFKDLLARLRAGG
ncbi:RluA family pseudouridine synthase [Oscillospiraceae bacterium HV4-5-C5C]|nr:RluA family pseudouridine synthase [Oscillospiraceae bacterium HV4-5-C5C]